MEFFLCGIALVLAGGVLALVLPERWKARAYALLATAGGVAVAAGAFGPALSGQTVRTVVHFARVFGEVPLVLDPLAAFFALAIALTCVLGAWYGLGYLRLSPEGGQSRGGHFFFLGLLSASMLLVTAVQHALAFLIIWEFMSLSSFFLVLTEQEKDEVVEAAYNYLISMHVGVVLLIGGFLFLQSRSGSPDFGSFAAVFQVKDFPSGWVFAVLFAGFGIKAGFVPLHTWLPRAHPAAPSHVSAIMSGIMIKTGIYGILRCLTWLGTPDTGLSLAVLGIATASALLGVVYAIAQHDLKRLLAYHSVENIGLIGMGIGVGMLGLSYGLPMIALLGFAGALLHVLNHSIFKALLFYGAGAVYQRLHTRNIENMGGLARSMPLTSGLFIAGSAAICGLPPLNGFISEFLIYAGAFSGIVSNRVPLVLASAGVMAALALVGVLALICFTKVCGVAFLGLPRQPQPAGVADPPASMSIPMLVLGGLALGIGVGPQLAVHLVFPAARSMCGGLSLPARLQVVDILADISLAALILLGLTAGLLAWRAFLLRHRPVEAFRTWDCGYQAGTPRMQYTASSFAAPLMELVHPVLAFEKNLERPAGLFPESASYQGHPGNIFEAWLIKPVTGLIHRFMERFTWIQSGSTQRYILYGLVFLVVTLLVLAGTP